MTDSALGLLGVDLDQTYSASAAGNGELPYAQGERVRTKNGEAVLVKAGIAIPQYSLVMFGPSSAAASASTVCVLASLTNATSGRLYAVAQTSIALSEYGWVHTESNKEGRILCNTAETGVPLFLLGSGGQVDDAVTSGKALTNLFILASVAASVSAPPAIWSNITLDRSTIA